MKRIISWVFVFIVSMALIPLPAMPVFASSVTLDEAKNTPGIYIKDGNRYTLIESQQMSQMFDGSRAGTDYTVYLLDGSLQIQRVPNNAQLVLIGVDRATARQVVHNGYTIPYYVDFGIRLEQNSKVGLSSEGYSGSYTWYETINGKPPYDFSSRMVYTRQSYSLMQTHGVFNLEKNEQISFGRFIGTEFRENTFVADKRFFTSRIANLDLNVERTMDGYFLLNIPNSTNGYYYIDCLNTRWYNWYPLSSVIEFVDPPTPIDSASIWAREEINVAVAKGFVPADLQGSYANIITRAEFCRMAIKWVEYSTGKSIDAILSERNLLRNPNVFTDTSDPDILAAFALGITSGTGNNQFSPNGEFSRQQAATMIMNTCRVVGANVSNPPASGFADMGSAASWAVDGIDFVRANGIMQGTGSNNFSPTATYTREQSIITFNNINYDTLPGR